VEVFTFFGFALGLHRATAIVASPT